MLIKWLHLSDIHFNYKNFDSRILRKDFIARIKNISQTENFTHLFLTGDILDKYSTSDSTNDQTISFINELISAMGITPQNVFIVPGNHDHYRDKTIELTTDIHSEPLEDNQICEKIRLFDNDRIKNLLDSFGKFSEVYEKIKRKKYFSDVANPHSVEHIGDLSIVKVNTAWLDIDSNEENNLYCGADKLLDLLELNEEFFDKGVNIAIGHHPLEALASNEKDRVLSLFSRYKIGLYFCGHVHIPAIKYFDKHDVLQLACIGGFADGYSKGGYVSGICDTDSHLYKAEFYNWNAGSWYIESSLDGTNERGICYFDTKQFKNNSDIVAVDFKLYGGHISKNILAESIGDDNFDTLIYPYSEIDTSAINWTLHENEVSDFSKSIKHLISNGKQVHLFPLAPIPLLIKLGFELQKNSRLSIHQQNRSNNSWNLSDKSENIQFSIDKKTNGNSELIVKIATSNQIDSQLIDNSFEGNPYDVLEFTADKLGLGSPLYMNDVNRLVDVIFNYLNPLAAKYKKIHLIAAVPAGMALEIGRNLLESVYCNVYTYQLYRGKYCEAIIINRENEPVALDDVVFVDLLGLNNATKLILRGNGPCGTPNIGGPENEEYFPMLESLLGSGEHFVVKAIGDSMLDAGIEEGDYIVVRAQPTAENGQIVVALVDNNVTIKRFYKDDENEQIILHPENDLYPDIILKKVEIQGVAVHVIKEI